MFDQVTASREDLPKFYAEVLEQNQLLARIEASLKTISWSDEQIRTMQLLVACKSNASMQARIKDLEQTIERMSAISANGGKL